MCCSFCWWYFRCCWCFFTAAGTILTGFVLSTGGGFVADTAGVIPTEFVIFVGVAGDDAVHGSAEGAGAGIRPQALQLSKCVLEHDQTSRRATFTPTLIPRPPPHTHLSQASGKKKKAQF